MTTNPCSHLASQDPRDDRLNTLLTCLFLLALFLAPLTLRAAPDTRAGWTGGGGGNQNWSSAANWTTVSPFLAPPVNPMTQAVAGNGSGTIEHSSTIGSPEPSTEFVDVPWTIGALSTAGRSVNLSGQDLTIQQATASSLTLSQGAIQVGNNNSLSRSLNITNNIIFDDSAYKTDPTLYLHPIIQRSGNTVLNFYGKISKPSTNGGIIFRAQQINIYGGVDANLTPDLTDTANGPYNVAIAMLRDGDNTPAPGEYGTITFYDANNSFSYLSIDRGTVVIGTNNALPTDAQVLLGDTPSRIVRLALNDFDQTFKFIKEEAGTPSAEHAIYTGVGVGGTLTLNDNAVTNEWYGIVMNGPGRLVKNGNGTLIMDQNQTYTGGTTIGAGILQLGNGGAGGLLDGGGNITNHGTLIINSTDFFGLNGNLTGTGGLQSLAAGTVSLNGVTLYSGPTTVVGGGTLLIGAGGNLSGSPAITLGGGATLDLSATTGLTRSAGQSLNGTGTVVGNVMTLPGSTITVGSSAGTLHVSDLALNTTTINMELSGDSTTIGGGVNDLVSVANTLTLASVSTIYVSPLAALDTATPYKIMQYGTLVGLPSNLTATLPYAGRYSFAVQDAPPYIQLAVTASLNGDLLWKGGNPSNPTRWDVATTTNWLNGAAADAFLNHDPVAFDDNALTNRVTLVGAIDSPSLVALNNSLNYTLEGSGSLTLNNLAMQGSGSFTIANSAANTVDNVAVNAGALTLANSAANSLGNVAVTNGTLTIANDGANTYGSIVAAGGTLAFNQPGNETVSTSILGGGTVAKNGASTLTLAADNTAFTGNVQINSGVLKVTANNALGDGTATIASGASLEFNHPTQNDLDAALADVIVSGAGAGGQGAIYSSSAHQAFALKNITLAGDTTFGGGWENLGSGGSPVFTGAGFKVTKVGALDTWIASVSDTDIGDIEVVEGLFGIEGNGTTLGRPANTVTVRSNANFNLYGCLTGGEKLFVMDDGSRITGGGGVNQSAFGGPASTMNLNGTVHAGLLSASSTITYNGTLTGTGSFNLETTGVFVLAGENIHTGGIVVTNGALRVIHPLAFSTNMTVEIRTNGIVSGAVIVGTTVPRVELSDGVIIPPGVSVRMYSDGAGSCRTTLGVATATAGNEFQGTVIPHGDGTCALVANNAASVFTASGPITNLDFVGTLNLRGAGNGFVSGPVSIGGSMTADPGGSGTWTISSTGNQWVLSALYGPLLIGTNDALCVTAPLWMGLDGTLDLAGFNQRVSSIVNDPDAAPATGVIGNSSTTADSLLTIDSSGTTNVTRMTNAIVDILGGGTMKVAVTLTNADAQFFGANTYTGPTLVKNGAILGGNGSFASPVTVESGGTISPGASIGVLTINSTLTLNAGSVSVLEVVSSPSAYDQVSGLTSVSYGGTLVVTNIGAAPLAAGDAFQLFQAGSYSGVFSSIVPATPGAGLKWNTDNLATTGTISVEASAQPNLDTIILLPDGNLQLTLSGPVGSDYSIRASTNVALPLTNWLLLNSGTITVSPFTFSDLTATNFAQRFYRMSVP